MVSTEEELAELLTVFGSRIIDRSRTNDDYLPSI